MSQYKITYTAYPEHRKYHFSNCRATIEGNTFEEAVSKFSKQQKEIGMVVLGVVEGDIIKVTFFDINKE